MSRKQIIEERERFFKTFSANHPEVDLEVAEKLIRLAIKHDRLSTQECNGCERDKFSWETWEQYEKQVARQQERIEKKLEKVEERINKLATRHGLKVETGGDPRGYTVKIHFPEGNYNTWGGTESGYGVPSTAIGAR